MSVANILLVVRGEQRLGLVVNGVEVDPSAITAVTYRLDAGALWNSITVELIGDVRVIDERAS